MTVSIRNARSAIAVLERAVESFQKFHGAPPVARLEWHLANLLDSVKKCVAGMAAEIETLHAATGTGRAFWIEQPDGSHEHVCGEHLQALHLSLPGRDQATVIYGKPDALAALAEALEAKGRASIGPAPLHDIARQLGEATFHAGCETETQPPGPEKESAHGNP